MLGFVCEASGYIPRTGESIKVVLEKENEKEDNEDSKAGSDCQDLKERHQIYKLEPLFPGESGVNQLVEIIKLYDIRAMKELESFRGHRKDVTALAWHPFHEEYFVSGSFDGSIFHWIVGHETPQVEILNAHDNSVWNIA
ncbi:hypothetical protein REPUB_Repub05bG0012200 [Reevesia pubescens]